MNVAWQLMQQPYMQQAMLTGSVVAALCAVLSCFVILKGWSLMGDAISHAVLPGIVLAYLAGWPLALGAFLSGLFCSATTGYIRQNTRIREDTVLGVVFTGLFALGMVLHSQTESDLHLDHILFGNVLGIPEALALQVNVTAGIVLAIVLLLRRDFLLVCFDLIHAAVLAIPARWLLQLLLALLVLAIVVSVQAVGIILVTAMLITPGCTAHLWTDRFDRMWIIATFTAVASTVAGIVISAVTDAHTAGCIVLAQSLCFILSFLAAPRHGWLTARFRRKETPAAMLQEGA